MLDPMVSMSMLDPMVGRLIKKFAREKEEGGRLAAPSGDARRTIGATSPVL